MKRRVRQNIWGNWRGYEGNRYVREFASDVPHCVAGGRGDYDMPEDAKRWLAGEDVPSVTQADFVGNVRVIKL